MNYTIDSNENTINIHISRKPAAEKVETSPPIKTFIEVQQPVKAQTAEIPAERESIMFSIFDLLLILACIWLVNKVKCKFQYTKKELKSGKLWKGIVCKIGVKSDPEEDDEI